MNIVEPPSQAQSGLSVRELLDDPALGLNVRLVAGAAGLDRMIHHPRIQKSGLALVLALSALSAQAECAPPTPSTIPDGSTASEQEMLAAMKAFKQYDAEATAYLKCLETETLAAIAKRSGERIALKEKQRSAANAIVAPRIFNYQRPGAGWTEGVVDTPEKARAWVRWCAANGVDGMKLVAYPPRIMAALLDEARKTDVALGSVAHLEQRGVEQMNALAAA